MALAIKATNLSKAYQLGEIGTGTLSRDIERWIAKVRGKEDPFLKIGEANDRASKGTSDIVWSLKDIDFEVKEGDAVGLIGRNGAGKSTLLKLLSRVTSPTTGNFKVKGRIASLLEVGTGFHPELTGTENIYLNGAILGMRKNEIKRKFDEIVDFAGVERYVDTPVKRYSSGMYVRLAFAVAAHLESEILIVDEVLAVGDAEFQKKCLGKMGDISKGEGRTVLFVSHNMSSIASLCNKGIVLKNGQVQIQASANECINYYYNTDKSNDLSAQWLPKQDQVPDPVFSLKQASLVGADFNLINGGAADANSLLYLVIEGDVKELNPAMKIGYELLDQKENIIFSSLSTDCPVDTAPVIKLGMNKIVSEIPIKFLHPGRYVVRVHVSIHHHRWICNPRDNKVILNFELWKSDVPSQNTEESIGIINIDHNFVNTYL